MEQVARIQSRIRHLQGKEEKDHQKMWKDRFRNRYQDSKHTITTRGNPINGQNSVKDSEFAVGRDEDTRVRSCDKFYCLIISFT